MKSEPIILRPEPVVAFISPFAFHRYASEWLNAADTVVAPRGSSFSPVPYFLYCRAIELALKAFLFAKIGPGNELERPKKLGHNLVKVLAKAEGFDLDQVVAITSEHREEIAKANFYYDSKDFEYFGIKTAFKALRGYPDLPDLQVLADFASRLVKELEPICLKATRPRDEANGPVACAPSPD